MAAKTDNTKKSARSAENAEESAAVQTVRETQTAQTAREDEPQIWIYYGPSVRGAVTHGRIFRGSRVEVLAELKSAIEKYPQISRLIIADRELKKARNDMKERKGIYIPYEELRKALDG